MSTSIEGRICGSVKLDTFADITPVPLAPKGITANGLLFDGALTDAQVIDIWWRATSRDANDETARRALAATRDDPDTPSCCVQVIDYLLGETP